MYGLDVYKQMDRRLKNHGWKQRRRNGSHFTYVHPECDDIITINLRMSKMVAKRLIKKYNL